MKAEWKVIGQLDNLGKPVFIGKIRTEHEVILSPESLATVKHALNNLEEHPDLQVDKARFVWELQQLIDSYELLLTSDRYPDIVNLINSDWRDFKGNLTLDALKAFADALQDIHGFRIEGSPQSGMFVTMTDGIQILRVPVDENKLVMVKAELQTMLKGLDPRLATANVAVWAGVAIGVATLGINAFRLYREEQDRARRLEEDERRKAQEERVKMERDCHCPGVKEFGHSEGGPNAKEAIDRIGRMC